MRMPKQGELVMVKWYFLDHSYIWTLAKANYHSQEPYRFQHKSPSSPELTGSKSLLDIWKDWMPHSPLAELLFNPKDVS